VTREKARHRWTLQSRLMVAVIGMVAFILVMIAVSTSAIITGVLQTNLTAQVAAAGNNVVVGPTSTASDVLAGGPFPDGTVLVLRSASTGDTGAYVDGRSVKALDDEQVSEIRDAVANAVTTGASSSDTVDLPGLGDYRIGVRGNQFGTVAVLGLPLSQITATIGAILTTVALVTAGGLLLLSAIIAVVIRVGLRPLRGVAETATRVASIRMDQGDVSTNAYRRSRSTSTARSDRSASR